MSKIGRVVFGFVSRRSYGVYARRAVNVEQASAAAAVATAKTDVVAAADASTTRAANKLFWMRDPKTGCWIPENRFQEQEVDVVDLRNQLIRHK